MIEFLPAPDHVLAYRLEGRLTADDYDRMIADVEAKLAAHEHVAVYADATGFEDITPEAVAKDFAYSFSKISQWGRFKRMALVTDKGWLRLLAKGGAAFVPGIDYRIYDDGEQAEALAWISAPLA